MQMFRRGIAAAGRVGLVTGLVAALVIACGGGGGGTSFAGIDRLGVSTGTITGFGSIYVNGVKYSTSGTTSYDVNDDKSASQDDLQVGQQVTVRWRTRDDGVTRRAEDVIYDNSLAGPITAGSIDPVTQSFVVLGQAVIADADTSFASPLFDLDSLADGDFVLVSGLPDIVDSAAVIRATRIERGTLSGEFEIHGVVSGRTATSFVINGQVVNTVSATIEGGIITDGDFVEARGSGLNGAGELVATKVQLEDGEDRIGGEGDEAEVEGYVTSIPSAGSFTVSGVLVLSSVSVAMGDKVRVEGTFNATGAIVAEEVQLRSGAGGSSVADTRIAARVDSVTPDAANPKTGQLVVLGVTIQVDANTRLEDQGPEEVRDFSLADLQAGASPDFVEVRGIAQDNNTIRATLLQRQEQDVEGRIRGQLGSLSEPNFTILGVVIATDEFTGFEADDEELSAAEFFGGAVAIGDELKVKFPLNLPGSASTPVLADEVEIED